MPALQDDLEIVGNASVDLWISTTGVDADIQVTLIEVRQDGQEMYVQNGWLRLSHAALDENQSTVLQPVHIHKQEDAKLLEPAVPVFVRMEVLPFNHLFRAGSSLRLSFDTPGGWFAPLLMPVQNTIHVGPGRPSQLVFGSVQSSVPVPGYPPCESLVNQPCRGDAGSVPDGFSALRHGIDVLPVRTGSAAGAVDAGWLVLLLLARGWFMRNAVVGKLRR